ncbi:MAG TPA: GNAT family N-acetyltransferase [Aridibacter sp.]|nr:GNAT family N-acetyltransferase [Aridibacter sp.]
MAVELREITPENFDECIRMSVSETQSGYVATNLMSIAQSKVYPTLNVRAVYDGEEMVGFVMYGFDPDENKYSLVRLMVDASKQGKGFGRQATMRVIEDLRNTEACDAVYLSYVPENTEAEKLYSSIGFERTGETDQESGEIVMRYTIR